jgi:protein TonB
LPSKSNASKGQPRDHNDARRISPFAISAGLHTAAVSVFALLVIFGKSGSEKIEIEVIERPVVAAPAQLNLSERAKPEPPKPVEKARKVFGVSKHSLTTDEPGAGVSVKAGNTVAVQPDDEKLKDSDSSSLPIPADEYLVSKMPSVAVDVRIPYPPEAKEKKIEGKVVLDLLIDAKGIVRDAKIISGPGYGLNEAALQAITQFKFKPAEVDGKPVAVRIPFTYNFLLKSE